MEPAPAHQPRPLVIDPTKCRYEIPNKRRQCSRQPTRSTAFCGNHAHLPHGPGSTPSERGPGTAVPLEGRGSGQGQECADARGDRRRIPCPIDPAHTVSRRATRDSCHTRHTSLPHVPPMDHISPTLSPHLRDHRSSSLAPPLRRPPSWSRDLPWYSRTRFPGLPSVAAAWKKGPTISFLFFIGA
jgi:hypothetical protein